MPKVSQVYGGTYLSGADLAGRTHQIRIEAVAVEEVGDEREEKLVVIFVGAKKSLVLNKTNASTLVSAFGDDTDAWVGRQVELFTVPVNFNGKTFDGVRVRAAAEVTTALQFDPPAKPQGVPASQTRAAMQNATSDDIPF